MLQGADGGVVEAALADDAGVGEVAVEEFVELVLAYEFHRRRPAHFYLVLFLGVGGGRQADAAVVEVGVLQRVARRHQRPLVGFGLEAAVHVAGADAQLEEHRRARGLGQFKALFHHLGDGGQIGARVEQPHLRFGGEGVGTLLDDGRTFAIILANDNQCAALDAGRGEIGQRVGGDVGADGGLPGDGTAYRVIDRGAEHGCGAGFRGIGLDMDAQIVHDVARIVEHVHHVRHRRALVAADIGDARLQQGFGHGENALAMKSRAFAQLEQFHFFGK